MTVPAPVRDLVARHLREAGDLVEMLYVTGSVSLGDYVDGVSDVDFVAVTSRTPTGDDLRTLAAAHRGLPRYDGVYLDQEALRSMPDAEEPVLHAYDGEVHADRPCAELTPVMWLSLSRYGIAVRGPEPAALGLRVDPERLQRWNLDNLGGYWRSLAGGARAALATRAENAEANPVGIAWAVLGPARLHYTLATGDVTSKTGAGRYAIQHFPAWAELTGRALAWRHGATETTFDTTDGIAAAAMVDAIVDDAERRWT